MSTATLPNAHRVRQIAILVSSVDAAAARQLLLHMPTELAKQVRAMANKLGTISVAEKRAILAEFQKSAGAGGSPRANTTDLQATTANSSGQSPGHLRPGDSTRGFDSASYPAELDRQLAADAAVAQNVSEAPFVGSANPASQSAAANDTAPAWTRLSTEALVRFVAGERTAVIAVVVSQLLPLKAVEVLRQLPRETNRAVLQRLSQLQDIDPTAMSAIDEHLAERLSDYQHRIESEHENTRRLNALLEAAPPELQAEWSELLRDTSHPQPASTTAATASSSTLTPLPNALARSTQATIAELYGDIGLTAFDTVPAFATQAATQSAAPSQAQELRTAAAAVVDERPDILPFANAQSTSFIKPNSAFTPTRHVDFDRLLELSAQNLAALLSSVDSQTVLLALAGSTPDFMRRFVRMLKPADAKVLTRRLQSMGSINLRDVDEAQHRIVEHASDMLTATTRDRRQAA